MLIRAHVEVIEQYTKNVRFCIICNYVNKIIPAVQSRCTRFRCAPLAALEPLRLHTSDPSFSCAGLVRYRRRRLRSG